MEIVNMSKKKYNNLIDLELDSSIINTEAKLLIANLRNKLKVFKNLHRLSGPTFANKLYTLELLDTFREYLPESFVIPDYLCSVQGSIEGFAMELVEGPVLSVYLKDNTVPLESKIHYLKEVSKLLDQLDKIRINSPLDSIYINDLHDANIIIDKETKDIKVIDLDSCKIADNKPFPSKVLSPMALLNYVDNKYEIYSKNYGMYDENDKYNYRAEFGYIVPSRDTDIYCYIIMVLNFLYGYNINNLKLDEYYEYMYYLESIGIHHELIDYFIKIVSNADNELPYEELDSITDEQYYRAKKNVYNAVKDK